MRVGTLMRASVDGGVNREARGTGMLCLWQGPRLAGSFVEMSMLFLGHDLCLV